MWAVEEIMFFRGVVHGPDWRVTSTLTAYLTPYATLVHQGKGTSTQDKQPISWAASQSYAAAAAL